MEHQLFTHAEARASTPGEPLARLADWLSSYPMKSHSELGRAGAVCPFVKKSAHLGVLRVGINEAGPGDGEDVFTHIRGAFSLMEKIPYPPGQDRLRTIAIGFPNCDSPEGLAMLERVYQRHKYYTLFRFRMIAFFHAGNNIHGLWNPDFKPMRSPIPILATRYLIEQDAAFAAKHRIMTLPYLVRFGPAGAQRLAAHWRKKVLGSTVDA